MAGKQLLTAVRGFVHSIEEISGLSGNRTNARVLSDKSLYVLQNLANYDAGFVSRYGTIEDGEVYIPIEDNGTNFEEFTNTVYAVRRDLSDMSFEESLTCICAQLSNIAATMSSNASCGCTVGEGADTGEGEEGGSVPDPIGSIVFEEPAVVDERKCKAANSIHETIRNAFNDLDAYPIETWSSYGLVFAIGIITAVLAALAAPIVALLIGVAGAVSIFAAKVIISGVDLGDIVAELDSKITELVCLLYNSTNAGAARSGYLALLTGLSATEVELVSLLMTNGLMDLLYFDTAESAVYWDTYTGPVDCGYDCAQGTDHLNIRLVEDEPMGVFTSSPRFEVGDIVTIDSAPSPCSPTTRNMIYFEVLDNTQDQIEVTLSLDTTGWTSFELEAGCDDKSVYYGDDFTPILLIFWGWEVPDVVSQAGTAIVLLRSGSPFSVTVERLA